MSIPNSVAVLSWVNPTTRSDNTVLGATSIAYVQVWDSLHNGGPIAVINNPAPGATSTFTTAPLSIGTHNFNVIVFDTSGSFSPPSNIATVVIAATPASLNPATGLTAAVNTP